MKKKTSSQTKPSKSASKVGKLRSQVARLSTGAAFSIGGDMVLLPLEVPARELAEGSDGETAVPGEVPLGELLPTDAVGRKALGRITPTLELGTGEKVKQQAAEQSVWFLDWMKKYVVTSFFTVTLTTWFPSTTVMLVEVCSITLAPTEQGGNEDSRIDIVSSPGSRKWSTEPVPP